MNSVIDQKQQNESLFIVLTFEEAKQIVFNRLEKGPDGDYIHNFPTEQEEERIKRSVNLIQGRGIFYDKI